MDARAKWLRAFFPRAVLGHSLEFSASIRLAKSIDVLLLSPVVVVMISRFSALTAANCSSSFLCYAGRGGPPLSILSAATGIRKAIQW